MNGLLPPSVKLFHVTPTNRGTPSGEAITTQDLKAMLEIHGEYSRFFISWALGEQSLNDLALVRAGTCRVTFRSP